MELQEIDDRLKNLAKEIEELKGKRDGYLLMENLLQQQEKLIEKVCSFVYHWLFIYYLFL
jgi:hypothetical protein